MAAEATVPLQEARKFSLVAPLYFPRYLLGSRIRSSLSISASRKAARCRDCLAVTISRGINQICRASWTTVPKIMFKKRIGRVRGGSSDRDHSHTILRAQGVRYFLLSGGIVLPDSVSNESIFVPAGCEGDAHMPHAIAALVHWRGFGVPIVEVPRQRHLSGLWRREGKRNGTRFGASIIR